jgi:hypothetical protein
MERASQGTVGDQGAMDDEIYAALAGADAAMVNNPKPEVKS